MYSKAGEVLDRREMLRVKAKSLAEEARIIRQEEKRTRGQLRSELHWHRITDVRSEARCTYIAYGLVCGTPLERIESKHRKLQPGEEYGEKARAEERWKKIRSMIQKYGPTDSGYRTELLALCKS